MVARTILYKPCVLPIRITVRFSDIILELFILDESSPKFSGVDMHVCVHKDKLKVTHGGKENKGTFICVYFLSFPFRFSIFHMCFLVHNVLI